MFQKRPPHPGVFFNSGIRIELLGLKTEKIERVRRCHAWSTLENLTFHDSQLCCPIQIPIQQFCRKSEVLSGTVSNQFFLRFLAETARPDEDGKRLFFVRHFSRCIPDCNGYFHIVPVFDWSIVTNTEKIKVNPHRNCHAQKNLIVCGRKRRIETVSFRFLQIQTEHFALADSKALQILLRSRMKFRKGPAAA